MCRRLLTRPVFLSSLKTPMDPHAAPGDPPACKSFLSLRILLVPAVSFIFTLLKYHAVSLGYSDHAQRLQYIYIYIYICIYMYVLGYICVRYMYMMYIDVYIYFLYYTCIYVYMYIFIHVYIFLTYMHVYNMYTCVYIYMVVSARRRQLRRHPL